MRYSISKCSPPGELRDSGERAKSIRRIDNSCLFPIEVSSCQLPFLPPQSALQPAPPRGSLTIRRPSAAGDHHPALSVQGTHEENGKLDNRSPPFRVLKGWPRSGRVSSSFVQGTNEANCHSPSGELRDSGERAKSIRRIDHFCLFPIEVPSCQFSLLPPLTPPAPAPPRGSLSDRRPLAAGDHHPALAVQGTHETD